jgi:hypothetical protein
MKNVFYGVVSISRKPVRMIGLGIAISVSYVWFLHVDNTLLKFISVIMPVPSYLTYLGYTYQWDNDLKEIKSDNKLCKYDNYQYQNNSTYRKQRISHIEKKETNEVTTTETIYFDISEEL